MANIAGVNIAAPEALEALGGDRRVVYDYLYQLSEQLNHALNNLELENFTAETRDRLVIAADRVQAVDDLLLQMQDTVASGQRVGQEQFNALWTEIVRTASEVTTAFETALEQAEERITISATEQFTAKADTAALEQEVSSLAEFMAREITFTFNNEQTYTGTVAGALQEFSNVIKTYIRFDATGITLGEEGTDDEQFTAHLSNTDLEFLQGGQVVASIGNRRLNITDARVTGTLDICGFVWQQDYNGGLSLVLAE